MVTVLPPGVIRPMPLCGVYPQVSKNSGVLYFTIGMIKKVIHFNDESPLIWQHDADTDVSLTYLYTPKFFDKSTHKLVVLIITKKCFHRNLWLIPNMFVTLQGENYMAKLYLLLVMYSLYHKENLRVSFNRF